MQLHRLNDLSEGVQRRHLSGVDLWEAGLALAHAGEDLDALNRVDAQVRFQGHLHSEHLDGVAGLL